MFYSSSLRSGFIPRASPAGGIKRSFPSFSPDFVLVVHDQGGDDSVAAHITWPFILSACGNSKENSHLVLKGSLSEHI